MGVWVESCGQRECVISWVTLLLLRRDTIGVVQSHGPCCGRYMGRVGATVPRARSPRCGLTRRRFKIFQEAAIGRRRLGYDRVCIRPVAGGDKDDKDDIGDVLKQGAYHRGGVTRDRGCVVTTWSGWLP